MSRRGRIYLYQDERNIQAIKNGDNITFRVYLVQMQITETNKQIFKFKYSLQSQRGAYTFIQQSRRQNQMECNMQSRCPYARDHFKQCTKPIKLPSKYVICIRFHKANHTRYPKTQQHRPQINSINSSIQPNILSWLLLTNSYKRIVSKHKYSTYSITANN